MAYRDGAIWAMDLIQPPPMMGPTPFHPPLSYPLPFLLLRRLLVHLLVKSPYCFLLRLYQARLVVGQLRSPESSPCNGASLSSPICSGILVFLSFAARLLLPLSPCHCFLLLLCHTHHNLLLLLVGRSPFSSGCLSCQHTTFVSVHLSEVTDFCGEDCDVSVTSMCNGCLMQDDSSGCSRTLYTSQSSALSYTSQSCAFVGGLLLLAGFLLDESTIGVGCVHDDGVWLLTLDVLNEILELWCIF